MMDGGRSAEGDRAILSPHEHKRRELILTQPDPANVRETASAVVLKQGSVFMLTTPAGDIPESLPHGYGLFREDCRFLDAYTLALNGRALIALSSTDANGFETHITSPTHNSRVAVERRRSPRTRSRCTVTASCAVA